MLPSERGDGQLFHADRYLCEIIYEIDYPLAFANLFNLQRVRFTTQSYDGASLTDLTDLILIRTDGTPNPLPSTLASGTDGAWECTIPNQPANTQ
jgi:hypothetical protein